MSSRRRRPSRGKRSPSRGRRAGKYLLYAAAAVLCLAAAKVGALYYEVRDAPGSKGKALARAIFEEVVSPDHVFHGKDRLNVLLMVEDITLDNRRQRVKGNSRSDTNILIALDRVRRTVSVLSLPRDTRVNIPAGGEHGGWHKLNAAHAYGGPFLLMQTVEKNLGVEVHHYLKTNAEGFVKIVDLVDGVDIEVERDMHYDDSWQDFHVHLDAGLHHLDGKGAEGYVRWRKNNPRSKGGDGAQDPKGDLGRIERQQKVMTALLKKALSPRYITRLRSIVRAGRECIETDLTDRELASLAVFLSRFNPSMMERAVLPVRGGAGMVPILRDEAAPILLAMFGHTFDQFAFMGQGHADTVGGVGYETLREPAPSRLREFEDEPEEWETVEPEPDEAPGEPPLDEVEDPPDDEDALSLEAGASGVGSSLQQAPRERVWIEPPAPPLAEPDAPAAPSERPEPAPAPAPG